MIFGDCHQGWRQTTDLVVILFNMWYRPEDWFLDYSEKAVENLATDERIGIHWALLLKRYQVFYDLCTVIGGLFDYREEISLHFEHNSTPLFNLVAFQRSSR